MFSMILKIQLDIRMSRICLLHTFSVVRVETCVSSVQIQLSHTCTFSTHGSHAFNDTSFNALGPLKLNSDIKINQQAKTNPLVLTS